MNLFVNNVPYPLLTTMLKHTMVNKRINKKTCSYRTFQIPEFIHTMLYFFLGITVKHRQALLELPR
jgi:hypothetical protein